MPTSAAWEEWFRAVRDRARTGLVDLVRDDAPRHWEPAGGGQFKCCSPLKKETVGRSWTPSFYVYPEGRWYDFGQGQGGDAIQYVELRDGVGFKEALDLLARRFGLPTWEESRGSRGTQVDPDELVAAWKDAEAKRSVTAILTKIVGVAHTLLPDAARSYLHDRGFSDAFINAEQIGFVSVWFWEYVQETFPEYTEAELLSTGLFRRRQSGKVVAAMSNRLLCPYWRDGWVEYTIGREFFFGHPKESVHLEPWDLPKFKKQLTPSEKHPYVHPALNHELLWGEDCLAQANRKTILLMTEGIMDAYLLKILGYPVVSPVTKQPSDKQLTRFVTLATKWKEVVILNDQEINRAGTEGAIRTAEALWFAGVTVRIGILPFEEGQSKIDVNDLGKAILHAAKQTGKSDEEAIAETRLAFDGIVEKAVVYPEFLVRDLSTDLSLTELEEHLRIIGKAAQRLTALQRADLITRLFTRFPKIPKKDSRRVLDAAIAEEERRVRNLAKAVEVEAAQDPEAHRRATDPTALAQLRGSVSEDLGYYEHVKDGVLERISTFSLVLTKIVVSDTPGEPDLLACRVLGAGNETIVPEWVVPNRAWASRRNFQECKPSVRMQWTGSDDELQNVQELLVRGGLDHVPRVASTSVLGYHETAAGPRFVLPGATFDEKGERVEDLVYLRTGLASVTKKLGWNPAISPEAASVAQELLTVLPLLHAPEVIWPIVCWFAAAVFKPRLKRHLLEFPLLNVHGTKGSGKTSLLARCVWPSFSGTQGDSSELLGISTDFAASVDLASTNAIPLPFDEFRADLGHARIESFRRKLRRSYTGETESRGKGTGHALSTLTFTAPVAVLGETKIDDDPALVERTIFVHPNVLWIPHHPESVAAFERITQRPLASVGTLYQTWSLRADLEAMLERATTTEAACRNGRTYPERIRKNLVCTLVGLEALRAFALSVGLTNGHFLPVEPPQLLQAMTNEIFDRSTTDEKGAFVTRDAFDEALAEASLLASAKRLKEGVHFAWIRRGEGGADEKTLLFLHLKLIEEERAMWARECGRPSSGSPGHRALTRIAEEKVGTYIVHPSTQVPLGSSRPRGVLIDVDQIPSYLGVETFPCEHLRRYGGFKGSKKTFPTDN